MGSSISPFWEVGKGMKAWIGEREGKSAPLDETVVVIRLGMVKYGHMKYKEG